MRVNTLADLLNVRPSSATKMVQKLTQLGLLKYEKYGIILLTEQGKNIGTFLLKRHHIIEKFLENIGISDNILVETELIEHNVSKSTLRCIDMLNEFFNVHPHLIDEFESFKLKHSSTNEL
jgi:Mn-dependent DtxR family transcriptional regulator